MSNYAKHLLSAWLVALALCNCNQAVARDAQAADAMHAQAAADVGNASIEQAFRARKSNVAVSGHGIVVKLLRDDNKSPRHQKFLLKINAQQTLLFAHNIDLAPRVPLEPGDEVSFHGEYVYNPKGGVMHWTHHAPRNDHEAGWIMHKGIKYQ